MQKLSAQLLEQNLFGAEDCEVSGQFVKTAPLGFNEDFFEKFLKLLNAESMHECDDITNDELLEMIQRCTELFATMHIGTDFNDYLFDSLSRERSHCVGRRIL